MTFRPEVQVYLRACEHLLVAASLPKSPPFSHDEQEMIEYYLAEVGKILAVSTKK
jgi:hypothetical protein